MANNDDNNTMVTVAAVGGGALALWLLLRGKGRWGLGGGRGSKGGGGSTEETTASASSESSSAGGAANRPYGPSCKVYVRHDHKVELNGVVTDLPTIVAACRAVGGAEVGGTPAALVGEFRDVVVALNAADVAILPVGHPDVISTIRDSLAGRY